MDIFKATFGNSCLRRPDKDPQIFQVSLISNRFHATATRRSDVW